MTREVLCRLLMDIVCNGMEIVYLWIAGVDGGVNSVLGILNQVGRYVIVV